MRISNYKKTKCNREDAKSAKTNAKVLKANSFLRIFLRVFAVVFVFCAVPCLAVSTSHWVHESEADFKDGTLHNVVVTNLGDVKLSREVKTVLDQDPSITSVNALAQGADGVVYAGTSPGGKLLAIKDDKVSTAATIDGAVNISSILIDSNGAIVLGTGGEKGKVVRIAKLGDKPVEIFSQKDVQYVWALQQTPDGNIYAATGPNGQVFEIKPDGSHRELFKSSEDNITSMVSDGKDILYLGTDPNGLVIRLNRKTKEPFILYNAGETEITALALDDGGNLYAATGEADDHTATPAADTGTKDSGRPEQPNPTTPIPANPSPAPPKPLPIPDPGEPQPIPKNPTMRIDSRSVPKMMAVMDDPGAGDQPGGGGQPGGDQPGPGQNPAAPQPAENHPAAAATPPANPPAEAAQPSQGNGNAIYKIDPEGFVTEVFREDVVIYSMFLQGQSLIVGTGGDGDVYQVNPSADETVVLATVDAKQVMCLLPLKDGRIFMGLANSGGVSAMTGGYASSGTYLSPVLDATQVSRFGKIQLHGQLPAGTSLQVATRSGNVKDSDATGWSKWSGDVDASEYLPITSPSARFLQYRLTFTTSDPSKSALVDHVDVAYQIPNLAPVVKSVKIANASDSDSSSSDSSAAASSSTPAAGHTKVTAGGTGIQTITWDGSDPNNDTLTYTLYFRFEQTGPWVLLKDKLKDTTYEWDTRTAADGQYQVRVVASDALSNPPGEGKTASRVSDYFIVDNTAPTIGDIDSKLLGNNEASISLRAQDRTSIVASVEYAVDSNDEWQTVLPVDGIFDSPDERVNFTLKGLTSGQHQVTIRATDSRGNQALATIVVKIESATAAGQ